MPDLRSFGETLAALLCTLTGFFEFFSASCPVPDCGNGGALGVGWDGLGFEVLFFLLFESPFP